MICSIDLYSMKRKTFILKYFIQFTSTNLDGRQKEGGNFFNLLQEEGGYPERGRGGGWGFHLPSEKGGSKPGGNIAHMYISI